MIGGILILITVGMANYGDPEIFDYSRYPMRTECE
jgi:hypothetical protein